MRVLQAGVLLSLLAAVGCASSPAEPEGPEVLVVNGTKEQQAQAEAWWSEQLECTGLTGKVHLHGLEVHLTDGYPIPPCVQSTAGLFPAGCTLMSPLEVWVGRPWWTEAVRHEYLHVIMAKRGLPIDYGHTSSWWCQCDKLNATGCPSSVKGHVD